MSSESLLDNTGRIHESCANCLHATGDVRDAASDLVSEVAKKILDTRETVQGAVGYGAYQAGRAMREGTYTTIRAVGCAAGWTERQIGRGIAACGVVTHLAASAFVATAEKIADGIHYLGGLCGYLTYQAGSAVGHKINNLTHHVVRFVKNNWKSIIVYMCAFGIAFGGTGLLYGFQAVAYPLAVGFGIGAAAGGVIGVLTVNIFDPKNRGYRDTKINTVWGALNRGIEIIEAKGVRPLITAIVVAVLIQTTVIYPHAMGGVFGFIIGNQLFTKIGFDLDLGQSAEDIERNRVHLLRRLERDVRDAERLQGQLNRSGESSNGNTD